MRLSGTSRISTVSGSTDSGSGAPDETAAVGSAAFSFYASNFGAYGATYGSLGAVLVLLMWFYISAYAILLGAQINAEIEHQTARDTTTGPEEPLGRREAQMADTVGRAANA